MNTYTHSFFSKIQRPIAKLLLLVPLAFVFFGGAHIALATITMTSLSATAGTSTATTATENLAVTVSDWGGNTGTTNYFEIGSGAASTPSVVINSTATSTSTPGSFSGPATGLSCNTTYSYHAVIRVGTSHPTYTYYPASPATFTTAACLSAPTVTTIGASGITPTSATLSGTVGSLGGYSSVTTSFYVNSTVGTSTMSTTGGFTYTVTGLTSGTTYTFYASASNASGTVNGSTVSFTTPVVTSAPTVTTGSATGITSTSATLNGTLTSTGGLSTTVGFAGYGSSMTLASPMSTTGAFSTTITGLTPNHTYSFNTTATNSVGAATPGSTVTFTTAALGAVTSGSTYGNLHGYAWSSTIGWISLNCAEGSASGGNICSTKPYGVTITANTASAAFSGKAWSSNIGWISFDSADTVSHCGASPVLNMGTNTVSGWAWVMNGSAASGADGCIKFSHATTPIYGVTFTPYAYSSTHPYNLQGYAWGSTNVGWVHFFGLWQTAAPTVDLKIGIGTAVPADSVSSDPFRADLAGSPATLVWTTSNTGSCSASSSTTGANPITDWTSAFTPSSAGGTRSISIPAGSASSAVNDTYTITCHSLDGSPDVSSSAYVVVTATNALEFYVNGLNTLTLDAGSTEYPRLQWTTANIQDNTCTASASHSDTDWTGVQHSSSTGTSETREHVVGPLTTSEDFTLSGCMPVGTSTPLPSKTVHVVISQPSCEVLPGNPYLMGTSGSSGLAISGVKNFGVVWRNVSTFPATTITKGSDPSGITSTWSGGSDGVSSTSLTATHTNVGVTVNGPFAAGTTTAQTITINASSGSITCTPATLYLVPFGVPVPAAASGTMKRPPWKEF